ncbi:MAG: hypothetical protein HKN91_02465, partial [Acidimicrobiia bacterium]|nr:hypothetical protein [Acidimicrobiia bacterium]
MSSLLLLALLASTALTVIAQKQSTPSSIFKVMNSQPITPGDGYMVAGELWETIKPMNTAEGNGVEDPLRGDNQLHWITFGPDGSNWLNPGGQWPGGWDLTNTWRDGRRLMFPAFEADGWPEGTLQPSDSDNRFAFAYYDPDLPGAGDPARDYKREATFTDQGRTHMIYEAGWPTNLGLDFKMRAHQYTVNEQNLNDFIAVEISVTNTGEADVDGDGTVDLSGHVMDALASSIWVETTIAVRITQTSGRSNRFGAGRMIGYAAAPDATGAPYDIFYWSPNVPEGRVAGQVVPPPGTRFFGVNDGRINEGYTDVWTSHRYMGAKQGAINDNFSNGSTITANSPDKQTLFGTHPVGEGNRKGWYSSGLWESGLYSFNQAESAFRAATATWYEDYGKTSSELAAADLSPNSNFFSAGTPDDVTTFVVGDPNARPNGDIKYASEDLGLGAARAAEFPQWEDALRANDDFYSNMGYTKIHTFGQDPTIGNGPYQLDVGESMTFVFVMASGFRFEGIADAMQAAEWAWERGWDISSDLPVPPAPEIKVESTTDGTAIVRWTDATAIDGDVDGYKVWRAAQFQRSAWLDEGFRIVDNYHRLHEVGGDRSQFLDPVNRHFDAESEFTGDVQGFYQPAEWGPYELIAKIPVGEAGQFSDGTGGYDFAYEDTDAITGFTYWYYVSAYKEGSYSGPQGAVPVGHIESGNFTRNGRNSVDAADAQIGMTTPWV